MDPENSGQGAPVAVNQPKKSNKTKFIVLAVVVLALLLGAGTYLKDTLFTGSTIESSDLVQDSDSGISFMRPNQWTKVEASDDGIDAAYTEDGADLNNSDQGMILSSEGLGADYKSLTESQKEQISSSFKTQFSNASSLENDSCKEVSNISIDETSQPPYDVAFTVQATCDKFAGRNIKATIKMFLGIKDESIHVVGVLAINETWEKSGVALDAIIASIQPAS